MTKGRPTLCVECGPKVEIDEDGCCVSCGNGAIGKWLDDSHQCTCPHGDANEPIANHDRACPIRANKFKRIAPEVALDRLASALATDPEVEFKKGYHEVFLDGHTIARFESFVAELRKAVQK